MSLADTLLARRPAAAQAGPEASGATRTLLIEGWRGVNHSYALVNQHQILAMAGTPGLRLFHRDLPFALPHWNARDHGAGFGAEAQAILDGLGAPEPDEAPDAVYRICSPFRTGGASSPNLPPRGRTATFMITEIGLSPGCFAPGADRGHFTRGEDLIITSTSWSKARIVEYGFRPDRVHVVPLGVDSHLFRPLLPAARTATRAALGVGVDEALFLNVGAPLWNKGADLLLRAFAQLRLRGLPVRLMVKDQSGLYGVPFGSFLKTLGGTHPELLRDYVLSGITVVPGNLAPDQLATLMGIADCYVSPYRAEGFNLPVLEAVACGVPVIATAGGATDDFCTDDTAVRVTGRFLRKDTDDGLVGAYVEPDFDVLVDAMAKVAGGWRPDPAASAAARRTTLERCSWQRAAQETLHLTLGMEAEVQPRAPLPPAAGAAIEQSNVLALLGLLRPRALAGGGKVRLGAPHDGGYVLPMAALDCDAVLSIGIGSDVSFDLVLAGKGMPVFQYDHTVDGPPAAHERFRFHKLGWGRETGGNYVSLDHMKRQLAEAGAKHPLLKFDVEGAEYELIEAAGPDAFQAFPVIACEVHGFAGLEDPAFYRRVLRCVQALTQHHAPVHLHANNYGAMVLVAGVPVPDVLEISFLRRDLGVAAEIAADPVPGPLDKPNHPLRPDICLTPFQ